MLPTTLRNFHLHLTQPVHFPGFGLLFSEEHSFNTHPVSVISGLREPTAGFEVESNGLEFRLKAFASALIFFGRFLTLVSQVHSDAVEVSITSVRTALLFTF